MTEKDSLWPPETLCPVRPCLVLISPVLLRPVPAHPGWLCPHAAPGSKNALWSGAEEQSSAVDAFFRNSPTVRVRWAFPPIRCDGCMGGQSTSAQSAGAEKTASCPRSGHSSKKSARTSCSPRSHVQQESRISISAAEGIALCLLHGCYPTQPYGQPTSQTRSLLPEPVMTLLCSRPWAVRSRQRCFARPTAGSLVPPPSHQ